MNTGSPRLILLYLSCIRTGVIKGSAIGGMAFIVTALLTDFAISHRYPDANLSLMFHHWSSTTWMHHVSAGYLPRLVTIALFMLCAAFSAHALYTHTIARRSLLMMSTKLQRNAQAYLQKYNANKNKDYV